MADIDDMINNVVDQDFSKSQTYFDAIMQAKMSDTLEQEKIAMANRIFNLDNPEGENFEDPEDVAVDVDVADESDEFTDEELDMVSDMLDTMFKKLNINTDLQTDTQEDQNKVNSLFDFIDGYFETLGGTY